MLMSLNLLAQETSPSKQKDSLFNESSKTFVPIPIINNSPAMKTGFGGLLMYFFKFNENDSLSPPSTIDFFGLYSTNNSYIVVPAAKLHWNQDKNRAAISAGIVSVNNDYTYDTETSNLQLRFTEKRNFIALSYSRKIVGDFYIGLMYVGTKTSYQFNQGTDEQNEFTREFFEQQGIGDNFASSIGPNFSYDTRDYVYYPQKGIFMSIRPKFNFMALGSETNFTDTDYKLAYYIPIGIKNVLALNLNGGFATGDVPFSEYQNYGIKNSLRGYQAGKYRGKHMVALQAEYRWNFYQRWGAVFFGGTGSVWGNEENDNVNTTFAERDWLPSAGLGARFMISRAKKINLRLDYAFGIDGNQGIYFGVMEAF